MLFWVWLRGDNLEGIRNTWTLKDAMYSACFTDSDRDACSSSRKSRTSPITFDLVSACFLVFRASDVSQVHEAYGSAWGGSSDSPVLEWSRSPSRCLASTGLHLGRFVYEWCRKAPWRWDFRKWWFSAGSWFAQDSRFQCPHSDLRGWLHACPWCPVTARSDRSGDLGSHCVHFAEGWEARLDICRVDQRIQDVPWHSPIPTLGEVKCPDLCQGEGFGWFHSSQWHFSVRWAVGSRHLSVLPWHFWGAQIEVIPEVMEIKTILPLVGCQRRRWQTSYFLEFDSF